MYTASKMANLEAERAGFKEFSLTTLILINYSADKVNIENYLLFILV